MMKVKSLAGIVKVRIFQILSLFLTTTPLFAQNFQLTGQGGQQISAFAHSVVAVVFYFALVGIIAIGGVVAYKLTHDQRGWEQLKMWIIGLAFFCMIEGIVGYFLFAANNAGLNNQGTLF
jgi:hypothetical protein